MSSTAGPSAGQNVFVPISHLVLRKIGCKDIHLFWRERENYILTVKGAQQSGSTILSVSLAASLNRDLLTSLIEEGEFGDAVGNEEQATDDIIQKWLDSNRTVSLEYITLAELETAIKTFIRITVNETDPELRIKSLFIDYRSFLRTKK